MSRHRPAVTDLPSQIHPKDPLPLSEARKISPKALGNICALNRFKQRLKITLAKPLITLALNKFKKDRPHHGLGKDLQQYFCLAAVQDASLTNN